MSRILTFTPPPGSPIIDHDRNGARRNVIDSRKSAKRAVKDDTQKARDEHSAIKTPELAVTELKPSAETSSLAPIDTLSMLLSRNSTPSYDTTQVFDLRVLLLEVLRNTDAPENLRKLITTVEPQFLPMVAVIRGNLTASSKPLLIGRTIFIPDIGLESVKSGDGAVFDTLYELTTMYLATSDQQIPGNA